MEKVKWYNVITEDRNDPNVGSYDLDEATEMVAREKAYGCSDAHIVVVEQDEEVEHLFYAVQLCSDDADWDCGSYDLDEAIKKVRVYREGGYPDAHIAVIKTEGLEPLCVNEIHDFDF